MPALLYSVLAWAMGGLVQTMLLGAGLSLVTYVGLSPIIESILDEAVSRLSSPELGMALQLALLGGLGEFLSIIGSAILTRMAISAATAAVGLKINSQG